MPRRKRQTYPSDLTKSHRAAIEPMIRDATPGGRPPLAAKREIALPGFASGSIAAANSGAGS